MIDPAIQSICRALDLAEPMRCERLGGTRNQNYLVTTSIGEFFLRRRFEGYSAADWINFDHAAMHFLADRDAAVVPSGGAADGWEVFPAVKGRHFRDHDPRDVEHLAIALSRLNQAGRDFPLRYEKTGPRGETDPREMLDLATNYGSAAASYARWVKDAAEQLPDAAFQSLPHTLIHGDVQPANVLMNDDRVLAFVDFDWCAWRPRIYDLAFAILLCCATHETPIDGGDIWSLSQAPVVKPELVRAFFESYESEGWLLAIEERSALRAQTILSWCHVRLAGARKVEPDRRGEFLDRPPRDLGELFPEGVI
jgi:Ser/Thr protein kinase RdoA (MazF antagonist)